MKLPEGNWERFSEDGIRYYWISFTEAPDEFKDKPEIWSKFQVEKFNANVEAARRILETSNNKIEAKAKLLVHDFIIVTPSVGEFLSILEYYSEHIFPKSNLMPRIRIGHYRPRDELDTKTGYYIYPPSFNSRTFI